MHLTSERILLRPLKSTDASPFFTYRSDAQTNQYQGWIPDTIEEAEAFIGSLAHEINVPDTWFQFAIINKASNTLMGDAGIHFIDNHQVELGCTLDKRHQRKGYASEALRTMIHYLFKELKKHRITTSIDPANKSSIQLVERLGFRKEAHFVESLLIDGKWCDDVVYSILQREWKKSNVLI